MVASQYELKQKKSDAGRKRLAAIAAVITLCCAQGLFAQSFVFSVRPEFVAITGATGFIDTASRKPLVGKPITESIIRGGWAVESGLGPKGKKGENGEASENGWLLTVSAHGGFNGTENIGAFLNIGKFGVEDKSGGGTGLSIGCHRVPYHINVIKDGVLYDRYTDYNYIIGGPFLKACFGKMNYCDITGKLLFGYRQSHFVVEDGKSYRYYYDNNFSNSTESKNGMIMSFSLGVGYTLIAKVIRK